MAPYFTRFITLAVVVICTCNVAVFGQFTTSALLLRAPGQTGGVLISPPTPLVSQVNFVLPSTGGTILVSPGPGISNAWLLGGNDLTSAGASENKIGSTSAHNVQLVAGGTGNVRLIINNATNSVTTGAGTAMRFVESGGGTDYVGLQAPAAVGTSLTFTLPGADGTSGQFLSTNGSGVLSWATAAGGGGGTAEVLRYFSSLDNNGVSGGYTGLKADNLSMGTRFFATTTAGQLARYMRSQPYGTAKTIRSIRYFIRGDEPLDNAIVGAIAGLVLTIRFEICKIDGTGTTNIANLVYNVAGSGLVSLPQHTWTTIAGSPFNVALPTDSFIGIRFETNQSTTLNADFEGVLCVEVDID